MFDRERFGKLLEKAKGSRSINQYGLQSGVNPGYISRHYSPCPAKINILFPSFPSVRPYFSYLTLDCMHAFMLYYR